MREHDRAETVRDRVASGRGPLPSNQAKSVGIGRLQPVPDLFDLVGRARRLGWRPPSWRGGPRRRCASAPVMSLSRAQRPVSSSASSQRGDEARQVGLAGAHAGSRPPPADAAPHWRHAEPATSAPPSPRDRRHSHRTARTAPDRLRSAMSARISPALALREDQPARHRRQRHSRDRDRAWCAR